MPTTNRPTFADFKQKALQNKEVQKEYEALSTLFAIKKQFENKGSGERNRKQSSAILTAYVKE